MAISSIRIFKFQNISATFAAEIRRILPGCFKKIEMPYLTKEKKAAFFNDFGGKATNTGSIEGQIALLTERINSISQHLRTNKKDFSTNRGLMMMVGKRKRLLTYLSKQNLQGYRQLIEKLGLRK
jgi:small subunit ribosomal protein S15